MWPTGSRLSPRGPCPLTPQRSTGLCLPSRGTWHPPEPRAGMTPPGGHTFNSGSASPVCLGELVVSHPLRAAQGPSPARGDWQALPNAPDVRRPPASSPGTPRLHPRSLRSLGRRLRPPPVQRAELSPGEPGVNQPRPCSRGPGPSRGAWRPLPGFPRRPP